MPRVRIVFEEGKVRCSVLEVDGVDMLGVVQAVSFEVEAGGLPAVTLRLIPSALDVDAPHASVVADLIRVDEVG